MRRLALVLVGCGLLAASAALVVPGEWFSATVQAGDEAMQHGPRASAGAFDRGDLANYQRHPDPGSLVGAVEGRRAGAPWVAGDHGDVLVLRPEGAPAGQGPLVRRALAWAHYDPASGRFDVPALGLEDVAEVVLPDIGRWDEAAGAYVHAPLRVVLVVEGPEGLAYPAGQRSGWLTKADRAAEADQGPRADGTPGLALVPEAWVHAKLVRVVDAEPLLWQVGLGVGGVFALGLGWMRLKGRLPRRLGRGPRRSVAALARAACEACGTAWGELAFCMRCGAHKQPADRWSPDALHAARAAQAARRR